MSKIWTAGFIQWLLPAILVSFFTLYIMGSGYIITAIVWSLFALYFARDVKIAGFVGLALTLLMWYFNVPPFIFWG